ncbi:hypothetical protein P9112_002231 [Eukaryota sp. TZLM1-RC]
MNVRSFSSDRSSAGTPSLRRIYESKFSALNKPLQAERQQIQHYLHTLNRDCNGSRLRTPSPACPSRPHTSFSSSPSRRCSAHSPYTAPLKVNPKTFAAEISTMASTTNNIRQKSRQQVKRIKQQEDTKLKRLLYSSSLHVSYFARDLVQNQSSSKKVKGDNNANEDHVMRDDVIIMRKRKLLQMKGSKPPMASQHGTSTSKSKNRSSVDDSAVHPQRFSLPPMSRAGRCVSAPLYRGSELSREFVKR